MAGRATERRAQISRTAWEVLARDGSRGLTHRAVDAAAGLAPGSVNYYFPTRDELLLAALEALFEWDVVATAAALADSRLAGGVSDPAEAARAIAELIVTLTGPRSRGRVIARHELLCEAQRRRSFKRRFEAQRTAFVDFGREILRDLGDPLADEHADGLIAIVDGLTSRQVLLGAPRLKAGDMAAVLLPYLTACRGRE